MARVTVRIDDSLHDWIKSEFPHGFLQTFLEQCILNLESLIDHQILPPLTDYSKFSSVGAIMRLVLEGKEEK